MRMDKMLAGGRSAHVKGGGNLRNGCPTHELLTLTIEFRPTPGLGRLDQIRDRQTHWGWIAG
jgi:hypothetical protein